MAWGKVSDQVLQRLKLNCELCRKVIYRYSPIDSLCDACYEPTGEEDIPLHEKPQEQILDNAEAQNQIENEIKEIAKMAKGLPRPTFIIRNQAGNEVGKTFDCVAHCVENAMKYSQGKAMNRKQEYKKYLEECISQLQEAKTFFDY